MARPPLTARQTQQAMDSFYANRESVVRLVLSTLDSTAFDAPALPYLEVLRRVQALIATEIAYYAAPEPGPETATPGEAEAPPSPEEDPAHA